MNKLLFIALIITILFFDAAPIIIESYNVRSFILLTPLLFAKIAVNKQKRINEIEFSFLGLYIYLILTIPFAYNLELAFNLASYEIILIISYLYMRFSLHAHTLYIIEKYLIYIGKYYITGSLLYYILGYYQYHSYSPSIDGMYFGLMEENILLRLRGFAESPNAFIPYGLFFFVYFLYEKKSQHYYTLLTLFSIILSFSTTAILALFVIFVIFAIDKGVKLKWMIFSSCFFILFILIYNFTIANNLDFQSMMDWRFERNSTGSGRFEMWKYGLQKFAESPLFGYGINQTRELLENTYHSFHNSFLEILLTGGIVGLFIYLTMLTLLLIASIKISKKTKNYKFIALFSNLLILSNANNTLHIVYFVLYMAITTRYLYTASFSFRKMTLSRYIYF